MNSPGNMGIWEPVPSFCAWIKLHNLWWDPLVNWKAEKYNGQNHTYLTSWALLPEEVLQVFDVLDGQPE